MAGQSICSAIKVRFINGNVFHVSFVGEQKRTNWRDPKMKKQIAIVLVLMMLFCLTVTASAEGETGTGFTVTTETNEKGNTVTSITDSDGVTFTVEEVEDFTDEVVVNDEEEEEVEEENSVEDAPDAEAEDEPAGVAQSTEGSEHPENDAEPAEDSAKNGQFPLVFVFTVAATLIITGVLVFQKRKK